MSTFTYVHNVRPENVRVVAQNGEIILTITGADYGITSLNITGNDIAGIARALGNVIVKPKQELTTV